MAASASVSASTSAVFTADQLAFLERAHREERLAPAAIVAALNEKFGTAFTSAQVRRGRRARGGQPQALRSAGVGELGSGGEGEIESKGAREQGSEGDAAARARGENAAARAGAPCPSTGTTPNAANGPAGPMPARSATPALRNSDTPLLPGSPAPLLPSAPAPLPAPAPATGDAHARLMEEFARKSEQAARRALDMALVAEDPRTVSAAAGAAKSLISTFRLCAGLDGAEADAPDAATFNFNFGNAQPLRESAGEDEAD